MAAELATLLRDKPEDLLLPQQENVQEALKGVKDALDPLAKQYSVFDQLHVDGLAAEQVYLQAEMIVDGALRGIFSEVESLLPPESDAEGSHSELESGLEDEDAELDAELDAEEEPEEGEPEEEELEDDEEMDLENLQDDYVESDFEGFDEPQESEEPEQPQRKKKKIAGLEDDGFDLSEYQKHVLALEQEDNDNDDEEIDYFAETKKDSDDDEDLYYEDFFGPRPKQKQQQVVEESEEESGSDDGMDEAEAAVRKDLFDSEAESEDGDEPAENLSRFERQQREIEAQIKELERENIGDKEWGMKGEVRANQRPQDSLVNAEIEFERNAKPAPVITEEVTQELDDLIKERIRKEQFDDLPRRTMLPEMKKSREVLPDVQETKSQKSLAELYEEDHARKSNPDYYTQQAKEGLERHHKEVIEAFAVVSRKLDALCSWNYTPRAPEPSVEVKTNAPAISMEEAQPVAMSTEDGLAPQEIYRPDRDGFTASEEMSKSSKKRRQNQRAKAKAAKQAEKEAAAGPSIVGDKPKRGSKDKMFKTLQRANVSVVDNKGRKRDMRGDKVTDKAPLQASQIKL